MGDTPPTSRAERRARTHEAILAAARQTFAECGYQKATIRAVAARAHCDPALVMQHFESKAELFRAATAMDIDVGQAFAGPEASRPERVLRHIFTRLDAHSDSVASTLRSMLTHDESAEEALQLFNAPRQDAAPGGAVEDPEADLRHQLLMALALGTAITRYVLTSPAVEAATLDELLAVLVPAAECLDAPPEPRP